MLGANCPVLKDWLLEGESRWDIEMIRFQKLGTIDPIALGKANLKIISRMF
jgi:hypothetical protein